MQTMTHAEWLAEATRRFGDDPMAWKFVCPSCGHIASVQDWKGFFDVAGDEIPCTPDSIKEICECDSEFTAGLLFRIQNVARMGELEERKN